MKAYIIFESSFGVELSRVEVPWNIDTFSGSPTELYFTRARSDAEKRLATLEAEYQAGHQYQSTIAPDDLKHHT